MKILTRLLLLSIPFSVAIPAAQLPVDLGAASTFSILGSSTVTNTGPTAITGDVGVYTGSAVTGFPPGTVTGGAIHSADGPAAAAQGALTAAYNDAAGRTVPTIIAGDIGGSTLVAGLYKSTSTLSITGTVTLDGGGDPNSIFIFQIASALTMNNTSAVSLVNGANAANVFWQVGSSATIGTTATFKGTIMAQVSVSFGTGSVLIGRALARTGAVTLDSNPVTNPGVSTGLPDLSIVKAGPASVIAGNNITYTFTAANNGPGNASTVSLTDTLPIGTTFVSFVQNTGPAFSLIVPAPGGTGTITATLATFNGGATATFTGVFKVLSSNLNGSLITNSATISSPASDPVPGNNTSNTSATVSQSSDFSVTKTGPVGASVGDNVLYTIHVSNNGPSNGAVNLTDVLPPTTTFVSATPSQGSCSGSGTVSCSFGSVAAGTFATLSLTVHLNSVGTVTNTATVAAVAPVTDPNPGNNSGTSVVPTGASTVPAVSPFGLLLLIVSLPLVALGLRKFART